MPNVGEMPPVGPKEHQEIPFSNKMERATDAHNVNEPPKHHVEQKKPGRKYYVPHDSFMWSFRRGKTGVQG